MQALPVHADRARVAWCASVGDVCVCVKLCSEAQFFWLSGFFVEKQSAVLLLLGMNLSGLGAPGSVTYWQSAIHHLWRSAAGRMLWVLQCNKSGCCCYHGGYTNSQCFQRHQPLPTARCTAVSWRVLPQQDGTEQVVLSTMLCAHLWQATKAGGSIISVVTINVCGIERERAAKAGAQAAKKRRLDVRESRADASIPVQQSCAKLAHAACLLHHHRHQQAPGHCHSRRRHRHHLLHC
jgi:hypothetical protein